jgi:hypothetical protein
MKKIMFSDKFGLTEAVLSGRKTQTRRVVSDKLWDEWTDYDDFCNNAGVAGLGEIGVSVTREYYDEKNFFLENCPYKVGEIVAVAQAYNDFYNDECDPRIFPDGAGWTNKMFVRADLMPNRIRITNVRVERLQDISDEDCIKEGVIESVVMGTNGSLSEYFVEGPMHICYGKTAREAYAVLIDLISGKGTWDSNPYMFVYDFELVD